MREKKIRYQVRDGEGWQTTTKAEPQSSGWLHYELRDGTIGLARPGTWRVKPAEGVEAQ